MADLRFLAAVKRIDAAVIYEFLMTLLEGEPGEVTSLSYERLANRLNEAGLTTGRDAPFSAPVVRTNLRRLEELGCVETIDKDGQRFGLIVRRYEERLSEPETEREPIKFAPGQICFHFENENENRSQNSKERQGRRLTRDININTKINKYSEKSLDQESDQSGESVNLAQEITLTDLADPTVDDAAKLHAKDVATPKAQRLRARIVREIYEPGLHSDLVDRAVLAVVMGLATPAELRAAINQSKDEKRLMEQTNGYRGRRAIWQTFALIVKSWFDAEGFYWTRTSLKREPKPETDMTESKLDALLARDAAIKAQTGAKLRAANARFRGGKQQ